MGILFGTAARAAATLLLLILQQASSNLAFVPSAADQQLPQRSAAEKFSPATSTTASAETISSGSSGASSSSSLNSQDVEFPSEITRIDRIKRAAKFWSAAVPIVASYYGKSGELFMRETFLGERLSDDTAQKEFDLLHYRGAEKLASTITSLKGFYVKTAQVSA